MKKFLVLLSLITLSCQGVKKETQTYSVGQIKTPQGEMLFWLYNETPNHKASFIKLAKAHYWDDYTFNRVINNFVIQGGCPDTPAGFSDSPYLIKPEFNKKIRHIYGAVGAGRDNNPDKLSAGCQLYIVHNKQGLARLDDNYVIFGQILKGFDVLENIAHVKTDSLDKPLKDIPLKVRVLKMSAKEIEKLGGASFLKAEK